MRQILFVLPLVLGIGCATVFTGTKDMVTFNTNPEGATILINGLPRGTTPATIAVERPGLNSNTVTLRKAGFQDITFVMTKTFNVVSVVNLGFIIGWGVDMISGSMMKNDQLGYTLDLEKRRAQVGNSVSADRIAFLHELPRNAAGEHIVDSSGSVAIVSGDNSVVVFE
jgi:hypothetical protein